MIEISLVATGALANAISATAGQLATALRPNVGRTKRADYDVASSFNSYQIADRVLPLLPQGLDHEALLETLRGNEVQALIQELLAVRLSDAPERMAQQLRKQFVAVLGNSYAGDIFDQIDAQVADLVVHLSTIKPDLLYQIRNEAYFTRLNATVETIERHLAAARIESDPHADQAFTERYRRHIVEHHGAIEPPDFDRRRRVPIADIYVEPTIVDETQQSPSTPPKPPFDIFQEHAIDRTVLLGSPGGGKTTTSQVILHKYAADRHRPVPFLVTLRDFAASDPPQWSILDFINNRLQTFYQCVPPSGLIERLLLGNGALVVFDGLDELVDVSRRAEVSSIIEQFCVEYPLSSVLVTSRVVGYDEARLDEKQFSVYRIEGFDDSRVEHYIRKWFALEPDMSSVEAETMASGLISECSDIVDLRSNPLMLALICILYRGERSIPRNRADVYEKCAELLFRKWDAHRKIHVELKARHLIEPALRYLAFWLLTNDNAYAAVTRHELVAETATYFQSRGFDEVYDASSAAEEFVDFCRGRAWVFSDVGSTANGEQLYTFTHRTFLEYFAARYLASVNEAPEKLAQAIAPRAARGEWDMVGQLAVQIKDRSTERGAERIFSTLMSDRRRRSDHHRMNILAFLARCLTGVQPRSSIVGALTNEMLRPGLWHAALEDGRGSALMTLVQNAGDSLQAVAGALTENIDVVVNSDADPEHHLCALILAVCIPEVGGVGNRDFWLDFSERNARRYSEKIVAMSDANDLMLWSAYESALITAGGVIERSRSDLGRLFRIYWFRPFNFGRTSLLILALQSLLVSGVAEYELFDALGRFLYECDDLPSVRHVDEHMITILVDHHLQRNLDRDCGEVIVYDFQGNEFAYLGILFVFAIFVEACGPRPEADAISTVMDLAAMIEFAPFAFGRMTGQPIQAGSTLAVNERYRDYFADWADGGRDFISIRGRHR